VGLLTVAFFGSGFACGARLRSKGSITLMILGGSTLHDT
jgi:hypothetical protein